MRTRSFVVLALALTLVGCASVPESSIELSATIGRDLDAVHTANRALAELHFDGLRERVDTFVDRTYRPYVLEQLLREVDLAGELAAALADSSELDAIDILSITLEEATARIEAFCAELREPVERQRKLTLASIDQAFQQLQTANAVGTGHLASVREVHDAQADALALAGLEDSLPRLSQQLAGTSAELGRILDRAQRAEVALDELPARVRALVDP